MSSINLTDLTNAKTDVDHIADVATSTAITSTDRLGHVKDTIAGAVYKIAGITNRGAWVTATAYATKDIVSNSGTWYVCVVAHTSSAAFATDTATKWRVYQGLLGSDLIASSGALAVNSDLSVSVAAAGATVSTIIINASCSVSANLTIPSTLTIEVKNGAVITIDSGMTLTINGTFQAGVFQCFAGSGLVVFGEGAATEYYPEWWLASGGEFGAAASKCFTATINAGAKVVFTKSHTATTPINCTANHKGWIIEGRGGSGASSDYGVTIGIGHTGVGFDCSGSEHITFKDFKIKGGPLGQNPVTTIPKVGFLFARNAAHSGCGKHSMYNVQCDYVSKFSVAALYNYGAEEMLYVNCFFLTSTVDRPCVVVTCSNPFAVASSFITLSSATNESTSMHKFIAGEYWNQGGGTTTSVIYLDGVAEISFDGGLYLNDTGKCLFYVNTDNSQTVDVSIRHIRDEGFVTGTEYAIWMHTGAQNPFNWIIEGNVWRPSTNVLYVDDALTPNNISYRNNIDGGAKGISVKNLSFSHIDMNTALFTGRAGGTLTSCDIAGNYVSMTFSGSLTNTNVRDYQYNSLKGMSNGSVNQPYGIITLTANAGSTTMSTLPFIEASSTILLTPKTANAAADVGSATGVYISAIVAHTSFTITHPNNANADKTFYYMIITGL